MGKNTVNNVDDTNWTPEQKVVGAAIAVILMSVIQLFIEPELPVGLEGAIAVLVAYFLPNRD